MTLSTFAVEDVYTELVIDVFYIFNSTVIDRTFFILCLLKICNKFANNFCELKFSENAHQRP